MAVSDGPAALMRQRCPQRHGAPDWQPQPQLEAGAAGTWQPQVQEAPGHAWQAQDEGAVVVFI